tara:strand:- start:2208 stop:2435 length:228 start_codon:yes stop_codon:yes gene_type:complete
MLQAKHIKLSDYSDELIRNAVVNYLNGRESNRKYASKYYATDIGRKKAQHRAKVYYWKTKKNNKYHEIYNPNGIK